LAAEAGGGTGGGGFQKVVGAVELGLGKSVCKWQE